MHASEHVRLGDKQRHVSPRLIRRYRAQDLALAGADGRGPDEARGPALHEGRTALLGSRRGARVHEGDSSAPQAASWLCIHRYEGSWQRLGRSVLGRAADGPRLHVRLRAALPAAPGLRRTTGLRSSRCGSPSALTASGRGFYPWPNYGAVLWIDLRVAVTRIRVMPDDGPDPRRLGAARKRGGSTAASTSPSSASSSRSTSWTRSELSRALRRAREPRYRVDRRLRRASSERVDLRERRPRRRDDRRAPALPQRGGALPAADRRRGGRAREADRARRPGGEGADDQLEPAARRLDREALPGPRALAARPDPGRDHRPDPRRREVRLAPRLQVLDLRDVVDPPGGAARRREQVADDPHPGAHRRARAEDRAAPSAS